MTLVNTYMCICIYIYIYIYTHTLFILRKCKQDHPFKRLLLMPLLGPLVGAESATGSGRVAQANPCSN